MDMGKFTLEQDLAEEFKHISGYIDHLVHKGAIRIELCGHLQHADGLYGFTLDKTKYQMVLQEETEEKVRVIIQRKPGTLDPLA